MKETSLERALIRIFEDQPEKRFALHEIHERIGDYYEFSEYEKELDPKYPQPRYQHEVRSIIARLEKKGVIERLDRDRRRLKRGV